MPDQAAFCAKCGGNAAAPQSDEVKHTSTTKSKGATGWRIALGIDSGLLSIIGILYLFLLLLHFCSNQDDAHELVMDAWGAINYLVPGVLGALFLLRKIDFRIMSICMTLTFLVSLAFFVILNQEVFSLENTLPILYYVLILVAPIGISMLLAFFLQRSRAKAQI